METHLDEWIREYVDPMFLDRFIEYNRGKSFSIVPGTIQENGKSVYILDVLDEDGVIIKRNYGTERHIYELLLPIIGGCM